MQRALRELDGSLERRDFVAAQRAIVVPLAHAPADLGLAIAMGRIHHGLGRVADAIGEFERATTSDACPPVAFKYLAHAQADAGRADEAVASMRRFVEADRSAAAWFALGALGDRVADHDLALGAARECLNRAPSHDRARFLAARSLTILGRLDAAAAEYRELIRARSDVSSAWFGLLDMKTVTLDPAETQALRSDLDRAGNDPIEKAKLQFSLGRALEQAGAFDSSFELLVAANENMRLTAPWNAARNSEQVDRLREAFDGPVHAATPDLGAEVIFIVGLPRSGSSLVEQILSSHSRVEGANELNDIEAVIALESSRRGADFPSWVGSASSADWTRMGQMYLARTARWRIRKPVFTDKTLENWKYAGAIRAMLPASRIVDSRRDAVETCLSCFKQLFAPGLVNYSYSLDDLADYWKDYVRLTAAWQARFAGFYRIQSYEALVAHPAGEIAALLDFCGLPFEEACLRPQENLRAVRTASSAQVRSPMRPTAHAASYAARLDRLRRRLDVSNQQHTTTRWPGDSRFTGGQ